MLGRPGCNQTQYVPRRFKSLGIRETMGSTHAAKKGFRSKKKQYKRKVWLCRREKDVDQIQDEIAKGDADKFEFDDELPGGGQFYCKETGKHFADARALADHKKSKDYKKRVKQLKEEKYTQHEADWASGMSKELLPPAHSSSVANAAAAAASSPVETMETS